MAVRTEEYVEASAPDSTRKLAPRIEYASAGPAGPSSSKLAQAMAEGEGTDWYAAWLRVCAGAGVLALVLLASSCLYEARASEPTRIWTTAELSQWAARLKADEVPAKAKDCVDEKGIDRACLQALWFGYDLTTVHKAGGGQ